MDGAWLMLTKSPLCVGCLYYNKKKASNFAMHIYMHLLAAYAHKKAKRKKLIGICSNVY